MKKLLLFSLIIFVFAFVMPGKKEIKIFIAGDSTASIKEKKAWPETGWGMPFACAWDSTVVVVNKAKNGRSTQSFMDEGLWKQITDSMQEGDYVFIQFGHNDEVTTKKTYTTPAQFKSNLIKYIDEAKSKKGIPVLLSPVARRKFDSTGMIQETHKEYSALVREVAREQKVIFLDIDSNSMNLYQEAGVDSSKSFFLHLKPGEHPNYPEGKEDNTHFSELGAQWISGIVLSQIRDHIPELAKRILKTSLKTK
jgi:lysophospholipase L1-like esterase